MSGAGELVGDGPAVAGHGGRVLVDLVEEEPQGAGDGPGAGLVEGDGDGVRGAGDDTREAADDGLAGDGAVFVVVAEVGVEAVREPVLGVVREEPQDHLQGPALRALDGTPGFGVDLIGGEPGGDFIEGGLGPGGPALGCGDFLLGGGDQPGVLVSGGDGGVAEHGGQVGAGAVECRLGGAGGVPGGLAGRVIDHFGAGLDGGGVVADLVDAVVLGCVFEEVLLAPPGFQPGQDVGGAGAGVGGQDLQGDLAVLEQGDLAGVAVVLDLDGFLGPGDLPGPAAGGDGGDDGQVLRDGEGRAAVADPADLLVAAVPEDLGEGAAAVEPEHDLRAGPGGPLQLGQGRRQGGGQAGWLAGDEAHGTAVVRGDVGGGAA